MFRPSYVFLLPALWMVVDVINFRYPGDEYGGWAAGSLPGLWVLLIVGNTGSISHLPPYVLAAGGATMAALGWVMEKVRTPLVPWAVLAASLATAFAFFALDQFPSWERAMAKNGSIQAYILPACNLGLVGSTVLMIATMGLINVWRRLYGASGSKGSNLDRPFGWLDL